jgi:drug/metabolite transporter (DMT)-like permease
MTHRQAIGWLTLVARVWGSSFTLTKHALTAISPLMLTGVRFAIASAFIIGAFRGLRWPEIRAGLALGALFWAGFAFQTTGLEITTPSRSAFITSLSSTLTPVAALAVHRVAPGWLTAGGLGLATVGMYLLTAPDGGGLNAGDTLTLGCAVLFACHIVAAAYYARQFEPLRLLAVQLGFTALLSLATAPFFETPRFEPTPAVVLIVVVLALTGLWSFYTQFRAQREVSAADAALVFMLEPVFATAISFVAIGERFTPLQSMGGLLILAALAVPVIGERITERRRIVAPPSQFEHPS